MNLKNIYRGREVKYYNELMSLRDGLINDFFNVYPHYDGMPVTPGYIPKFFRKYDHVSLIYDMENMPDHNRDLEGFDKFDKHTAEFFPTAFNEIINKYPGVIFAGYGILRGGGIIGRHTGVENRTGEWIRVHIPLIVPEGDIGFEVASEIVLWDDLFAFNNQRLHSAWNLTNETRLVFFFDIPRTEMDLPQGTPWTKEDEDQHNTERTPPFPKTELDFSEETMKPILTAIQKEIEERKKT